MDKLSLLFVCLGNICRSPAAEGITKMMAEKKGLLDKIFIDSAGIGDWHIGQLPDSRMRAHGTRHGYRFNSKARQICNEDFEKFDYIITMDEENYSYLSSIAPDKISQTKLIKMADYLRFHKSKIIPDPYYGDEKDFEKVIELLEDSCEGFLDSLNL